MDQVVIHTLGDSHAGFTFKRVRGVTWHTIGPVTMESVGKPKGYVYLNTYLEKYEVKREDIVILSFGEIDVRCHIKPQIETGEFLISIINFLINGYFRTIQLSDHRKYWIFSIPPPGKSRTTYHEWPYRGTDEERSEYTYQMNLYLKWKCIEMGIPFLNVYDYYKDERGMLRDGFSPDDAHIVDPNYIYSEVKKLLDHETR